MYRWAAIFPPRRPARRRRFVAALKDRFSGNLDRIQIIKGWLGKDGKPQEKIYDVVWGDKDRRRIVNGKLTPVGNTVDVATATWTNTIGDPELVTVWKDPDFDPSVRAVYYARVLEIPTPRWTVRRGVLQARKITDPKVPMTTQERVHVAHLVFAKADAMRIRTLLGEPMLHFLLIGIALFAAYRWVAPAIPAGAASSSPREWWTTWSHSMWRREVANRPPPS